MRHVHSNLPPVRFITGKPCVAHCPFCHREGLSRNYRLNSDRLSSAIRILKSFGFKVVTIAGGDPPDIAVVSKIANLCRTEGFKIGLTTLGHNLSDSGWTEVLGLCDKLHLSIPALNPALYTSWTGIDLNSILNRLSDYKNKVPYLRINYMATSEDSATFGDLLRLVETYAVDLCIQDILWSPNTELSLLQRLYRDALQFRLQDQSLSWRIRGGYYPFLVSRKGENHIYIRSARLNKLQTYPMCYDCNSRLYCAERVCSLRLYPSGKMTLCLNGPIDATTISEDEPMEPGIHRILNCLGVGSEDDNE